MRTEIDCPTHVTFFHYLCFADRTRSPSSFTVKNSLIATVFAKKVSFTVSSSFVNHFLKFFCGYGEKPWRVIGFSLLFILVLAGAFMFTGINDSEGNPLVKYRLSFINADWSWNLVNDYLTCFYYSMITFTTLGYGDVRPCVGATRYVSMFEAFFGAFSLAVFVLTFGRKMMR